jgi:Flp pilus assembly protein TadD
MSRAQRVCLAFVMVTAPALADTPQDCGQDTNDELRISACSDIIRQDKKAAWAHVNRGIAYSISGDQDRAIADFTTAIGINPREVEAYNSRGIAYRRNGNCDLAIADYDKAIEIRPGDPAYYTNRGVAYSCELDYRRAIAD